MSDGIMGHPRNLIFIVLLLMLLLSREATAATRLEPLTVGYSTFSGAYLSPETKHFAPAFKDKTGLWTTLYYNPMTIVYNTKMVPANERPKDWGDLVHPRYKGKMAIEHEQVTWYAGILKRFGQEKGKQYLQALSKQDLRLESSGRGNALLAAGEFAVYIGRGHVA